MDWNRKLLRKSMCTKVYVGEEGSYSSFINLKRKPARPYTCARVSIVVSA